MHPIFNLRTETYVLHDGHTETSLISWRDSDDGRYFTRITVSGRDKTYLIYSYSLSCLLHGLFVTGKIKKEMEGLER